ncbi:radical SAM protein [Streptococcus henryi]
MLDDSTQKQYEMYLLENHYFVEEKEFEKTLKTIQDNDDKLLQFTILTHGDCNFRCKYCYEKFENITMSKETEDTIIDFARKQLDSGKFDNFSVNWFGGEPLLGYKTIQRLSAAFRDLCQQRGIVYGASITTNGYLLNLKVFHSLVVDNQVKSFQITIDGDEESHDSQRILKNENQTYKRIIDYLKKMLETDLDFECRVRFNISKENYQNVINFLYKDGQLFRPDSRFSFAYHTVGDWRKGDRTNNYCIKLLDYDAGFELAERAINEGFTVRSHEWRLNNAFTCYANRVNHYMFNVRGIIQSCTVALYNKENIFGNINIGFIDDTKLKK